MNWRSWNDEDQEDAAACVVFQFVLFVSGVLHLLSWLFVPVDSVMPMLSLESMVVVVSMSLVPSYIITYRTFENIIISQQLFRSPLQ